MASVRERLKTLAGCRRATSAVEYGLILALVVLTIMVVLTAFAAESSRLWNKVDSEVRANT